MSKLGGNNPPQAVGYPGLPVIPAEAGIQNKYLYVHQHTSDGKTEMRRKMDSLTSQTKCNTLLRCCYGTKICSDQH